MQRNLQCQTYPVQRARGHSAVAGAAYRSGENLRERSRAEGEPDKVHRYANRRLDVREAYILLPEAAPDWAADRQELWNRVEAFETRKNARLGREVQLGLAYELDHASQRELVSTFAMREFVANGFAADVAIHNYGSRVPASGGSDAQRGKLREWAQAGLPFLEANECEGLAEPHVITLRNRAGDVTGYKLYQPHAHIRVTPRSFADGEFSTSKAASRAFNRHETATAWRYEWPRMQNERLAALGFDVQVRSTGDAEEAFPDVPRRAESGDRELHQMEQRLDTLSPEQREQHEQAKEAQAIDLEFRQLHNDTVRLAFTDSVIDEETDSEQDSEQRRIRAWWRNLGDHVEHWSAHFQHRSQEWAERLRQQAQRLGQLFSGYQTPPDDGPEEPPEQDR